MPGLREATPTNIADEWLLARVGAIVADELVLESEGFAAGITFELCSMFQVLVCTDVEENRKNIIPTCLINLDNEMDPRPQISHKNDFDGVDDEVGGAKVVKAEPAFAIGGGGAKGNDKIGGKEMLGDGLGTCKIGTVIEDDDIACSIWI